MSIEAALDHPGVLVVLEAFHSGWRAAVDGRPTPIFRANALFRAVPLAAGRHRVEMVFRPSSATLGAVLSLVSLVAALALWLAETQTRPASAPARQAFPQARDR